MGTPMEYRTLFRSCSEEQKRRSMSLAVALTSDRLLVSLFRPPVTFQNMQTCEEESPTRISLPGKKL